MASKTKIGTVAVGVVYMSRDNCLVSKRFASTETANAWLDRVGAGERLFFQYTMTAGGWDRDADQGHYDRVKAMTARAWAA